jgi:Mg2+ and Co2+ transporter CorA
MSDAILFDRDQVERLDDIEDRPKRLRGGRLLWVDVDRQSEDEAKRVAEAFGLDSATRECLAESKDRAVFKDHGRYIHVTTYAPDEHDEGELIALECVVGENWVITAHDEPIPVL